MKSKDKKINDLAKKAMDNIIFKSMPRYMAIASLGKITPKEAIEINKIVQDRLNKMYNEY